MSHQRSETLTDYMARRIVQIVDQAVWTLEAASSTLVEGRSEEYNEQRILRLLKAEIEKRIKQ